MPKPNPLSDNILIQFKPYLEESFDE